VTTDKDDQATDDNDSSDEELLRVARERFLIAEDAEADIRIESLDDMKFSAGDQWHHNVKHSRLQDNRPCLTINRLPQSIRQVTNDQKQNRPAIKVSPTDDKATVETGKVFQGIIRHIEYSSDADTAYDTAFDSAVRGGFGFFRIITDYCDPMSFDQEIRIKRIPNCMSVYLDPSYQQPDGSDANWGFVFEDLGRDDYEAQYPDSKLSSMDDWTSIGNPTPGWTGDKTARVAEYFYKGYKEVTLVLIVAPGGVKRVVDKSQIDESNLPEGYEIKSERKTQVPYVKWCKINGVEILERTDWPGKWIPIIPVLGEELHIDGKRKLAGIVRYAKDSQRMYNYMASNEAEVIALAPRAPWIGAEGIFEGHEQAWKTANTRNHAYLQFKPKDLNGDPAQPPQRNQFEPPVQAITGARNMAGEDIKATTGVYDPTLGNSSNEESGIAIQRRNTQAQTSNFHFMDNLTKSMRHAGRIIVDLIPKIYDTERALRILGDDGEEEVVYVNKVFQKDGKDTHYDLSAGTYDVTINTGPSFETKRQEAVKSMMDLSKSFPQMAQWAGDLMVRNMDWNGAQEIADRIKKMLPPQLQDDGKQPPIPPQVQQQMQQMGQVIQGLTQHLNEATMEIKTKKFELDSKERIAMAQLKADCSIELARLNEKSAALILEHEIAAINQQQDMIGNDPNQQNQQNQNAVGSQGAAPQMNQQQSTGGQSPGSPMGS
jgi:hypothetical protein